MTAVIFYYMMNREERSVKVYKKRCSKCGHKKYMQKKYNVCDECYDAWEGKVEFLFVTWPISVPLYIGYKTFKYIRRMSDDNIK